MELDNIFKRLLAERGKTENKMETKSRYEVIAELEDKKRKLIREKADITEILKAKKKELKEMYRKLEDKKEEIKDFEDSMEEKESTIDTLINSVDESLKRFAIISKEGKK